MKEEKKSPEKELNEMETNKLPDTDFKTMVIKMLKEHSENFNNMEKDIETIKRNQSEMKDTLTEMKNKLQRINSRIDEARIQSAIWNIRKQKTPNQNSRKK